MILTCLTTITYFDVGGGGLSANILKNKIANKLTNRRKSSKEIKKKMNRKKKEKKKDKSNYYGEAAKLISVNITNRTDIYILKTRDKTMDDKL